MTVCIIKHHTMLFYNHMGIPFKGTVLLTPLVSPAKYLSKNLSNYLCVCTTLFSPIYFQRKDIHQVNSSGEILHAARTKHHSEIAAFRNGNTCNIRSELITLLFINSLSSAGFLTILAILELN